MGVSVQGGSLVRETPNRYPWTENPPPNPLDGESPRRNMEPETEIPQKEYEARQPDRK